MLNGYMQLLASVNGFIAEGKWVMEPGMGFGSTDKWWPSPKKDVRRAEGPHSGLDIRQYTAGGQHSWLGADSVVPVAGDGKIISIIKDFLGYSVFVNHGEISDNKHIQIISAYGHIEPGELLGLGMRMKKGQGLGNIAEFEGMAVPAHLHLSIIEAKTGVDERVFADWRAALDSPELKFVDPMQYIGG